MRGSSSMPKRIYAHDVANVFATVSIRWRRNGLSCGSYLRKALLPSRCTGSEKAWTDADDRAVTAICTTSQRPCCHSAVFVSYMPAYIVVFFGRVSPTRSQDRAPSRDEGKCSVRTSALKGETSQPLLCRLHGRFACEWTAPR